ncbi:MAG: hypothetical protein K0R69_2484 [Clostridia bacterium]|jgi:hypothetical protein|nr:hypothetical protein [Clostridia bacterium]
MSSVQIAKGGCLMKHISQNIHQANLVQDSLDQAIDDMDITQINLQLEKLSDIDPFSYQIEDSYLFAKKIIRQNKKGNAIMKKTYKKWGTLTASLILTAIVGVSGAYAAGLLDQFTFFNKDKTIVVKSNQPLTSEEAKELADDAAFAYDQPKDLENYASPVEENAFTSVAEIKEAFGMDIVFPDYIPSDFQLDPEIHTQTLSDDNFQIYTTFTSKQGGNRRFGISLIYSKLPPESTSITVTDAVYKDDYQTPSGTEYTLFDEEDATMAQTEIGDIEYILVFLGFEKEEMYQVIDSTNLEAYTE